MSRVIRPHLPGTAFHITARTQGKEPWFEEPLRARIEAHLREGVNSSDAMLLAHAVMPNHFHLVIRQGRRPLGWVMQPIMRRIALLVKRRFAISGHVFGQRFHSEMCENADHLRRAIVYTNLNPERADMCDAEAYRWSSAVLYCDANSADSCGVAIAFALRLYGFAPNSSEMELRACYRRYVAWRREKDRRDAAGEPTLELEPLMPAGDAFFLENFCAVPPQNGRPKADLRDKAKELLGSINDELPVDELRRPRVNRIRTDMRRQVIAGLLQHRYRVADIANYFRLSDSAVSQIAVAMRYGVPTQSGM
jgi:REP element-mobilizing transposase RayT